MKTQSAPLKVSYPVLRIFALPEPGHVFEFVVGDLHAHWLFQRSIIYWLIRDVRKAMVLGQNCPQKAENEGKKKPAVNWTI